MHSGAIQPSAAHGSGSRARPAEHPLTAALQPVVGSAVTPHLVAMQSTAMKAAVVERAGGPFELVTRPVPTPGPGQVVVRVVASGVNPLDAKIRAGAAAHAQQPLPAVLGLDLAGVVDQVGAGVTRWRPGDQVYGLVGGVGGVSGTLAEYAAVDADLLAAAPSNLALRDAATLPLVAITAWEGLVDRARVGAGHRVLVHGGAGGVGHVAVQIAAALGAEVFATVHPSKFELARRFGAVPIDYTTVAPADYVRDATGGAGFDIVYDTLGGATLDASFAAVKRYTGHVVSSLGWGSHALAPLSFRGATYSGVFTLLPLLTGEGRAHHGEILAEVTRLVEAGRLRPWVDDRRFELATVGDAHDYLATGQARGKLVIDIAAA
jgi:NADPH:quinone reductase-like Zn-dependent oxidoreductase